MTPRIDDLPADRLRDLLETDASDLSFDDLLARADFVERIGGLDNARQAARMLGELEGAGR